MPLIRLSPQIYKENKMAYTLVAATTGGGTSARFDLKLTDLPATLSAPGLAGSEVVDIQISQDDGSTFANTGLQLTATENTKSVTGPGVFKVVQATTAGSVATALHRNNNL